MRLDDYTPERIQFGPVPLDDILKDSLYYPACATDGRPIRLCNMQWRHLGINSFVYCDFAVSERDFLRDTRTVLGYHVLGHRHLSREEYIPAGWRLEMVPADSSTNIRDRHHYWDSFLGCKDGPEHFAHWVVFERNPDRDDSHGPERFSLLFVCGEGLATYQQLYCSRRIAPKMLCFIQCWGFAGNWTNFTGVGAPFHKTLLKYRDCVPEWVCLGDYRHIDGAQRLRGLESAGLVCRGYHRPAVLQRRYGVPDVLSEDLDKRILTFPAAGRHFIALSVCHQLAPVLYEVVGPEFVFSPFPESITLRDKEGRMDRHQIW